MRTVLFFLSTDSVIGQKYKASVGTLLILELFLSCRGEVVLIPRETEPTDTDTQRKSQRRGRRIERGSILMVKRSRLFLLLCYLPPPSPLLHLSPFLFFLINMLVLVRVHILSIECGGSPSLVLHTREVRLPIRISQSPQALYLKRCSALSVVRNAARMRLRWRY